MSKLQEKLRHLDAFLREKHHLSLAKAIGKGELSYEEVFGDDISKDVLIEVAEFFFLSVDTLEDDAKELPPDSSLQVDEVVVNIRKGEYENQIGKKKSKGLLKRNFLALEVKQRKKLVASLILTCLPFLAFLTYSLVNISVNISNTLTSYKEGDRLSSEQQAIEDALPKVGEEGVGAFAKVKVGGVLESIKNISSANSSYGLTMSLRFDFDQMEYHKMWWEKEKGEPFNADNYYTEEDLSQDNYCFNADQSGFLPYPDNIPDIIQFNFASDKHLLEAGDPISVSTLYIEERAAYPGEKSSNTYASKNDEFSMGNGKISPDSLEYQEKGKAYYDEKTSSYRYAQKLHFDASINKTFDSPRYPLDSAQFHIYIQPTRDVSLVRYVDDKEMSGFSTYFSIGDGYRLIKESEDIKNFTVKLNYYSELDRDPSSSNYGQKIIKSQLELIVRANKQGISIFLNSFLNIVAIGTWLLLAFYNQSYNGDDSIGMIGTGFFAAISAILLGFSLVSNANIFSLLSLVNIFTLGLVLVMGYESISAKRANRLGDASLIAYRSVKIRVLFYFLLAMAVAMDLLLPCLAYLWIL